MALTLAEANKLSNDMLLQGVVETMVKDSPILQQLPFIEIVGNGLTYNQENTLPTIDFYDVGDTWAESTPTFTQKTANLKIMGGTWGSATAWDKSTGALSGVACVYDGDWNLFVTGQDSNDNFKLWSLIYGDGDQVPAGNWSDLKEFATAPADSSFEYHRAFLDKPDVCRGFFVEKFTGTETYSRPFWSHTVADAPFADNLWHEPVPFDLASEYGLAIGHHGDYCWLSAPYGVWRASLAEQELDLTADVLSLREEVTPTGGQLTVELRNDDGRYATPGQGELAALDIGAQLHLNPGYYTSAGTEVSPGLIYAIESREHVSQGGKASLVLHAYNGWTAITNWKARRQFRWNGDADEMSVRDMLAFVLARVGLKLEVVSQSSVITGFYPDFTIHAGSRGETVIGRLLSFVPDVLLVEGNQAYIINPQDTDSPVYAYGTAHPVIEGRYQASAWPTNRVQVEGFDPTTDTTIVTNAFAWDEIDRLYDRLTQVEDRELNSTTTALARGQAYLREAEMEASGGFIRVPANCGHQLYDVIEISDSRAGLDGAIWRVAGLTLVFDPRRGQYEHRLKLGGV